MTAPKKGRGGARPGAGRPRKHPLDKVRYAPLTLRIRPDQLAAIRAAAARSDVPIVQLVLGALRDRGVPV